MKRENPYESPSASPLVDYTSDSKPRFVDWHRAKVATIIDGGTKIATWTYFMVDRSLHGRRYVPYPSQIDYTAFLWMMIWTLVGAIPDLLAATYVAYSAKRSWLGTFLVYIVCRSFIVFALGWDRLPHMQLSHYLMYLTYVLAIVLLGILLARILTTIDRTRKSMFALAKKSERSDIP